MAAPLLLALDQGTTSTRALLFDAAGAVLAEARAPLEQHYPADGWVEHDAEEILAGSERCLREVLARAGVRAADVAALGITNQRETVVVWERATGRPIHRALVWQDRRTAARCDELRAAGHEPLVAARTGLRLDPYFSATKIAWVLDAVPGARARAEAGELAAGTVDCWLVARLAADAPHLTDATNASRTALFDVHAQRWDPELLALFDVPAALLPEVRDGADDYGVTRAELFDAPLRIAGVVGDQQSAALGQACLAAGDLKVTFGTGAFALLHTGEHAPVSRHGLLGTVASRRAGRTQFALEGSVFSAGSTVQWLRDELGLLRDAAQSAELAARSDLARNVHLVPAFTGLGAPHWDARARGAVLGLTRDCTAADLVRAGLESVAFQTAELLDAMVADGAPPPRVLRVDGGMAANDWFLQRLADLLGLAVERPALTETTALGAALLAGLQVGVFDDLAQAAAIWKLDARFDPALSADERAARRAGWDAAVRRVRSDAAS